MQKVELTPSQYYSLAFDLAKLPDLRAAGYVSASLLSKARDPLVFLTSSGEQKATSAMEWGSIVDCMWTTPELFSSTYIVLPADAPQKPTKAMLEAKKPGEESLARQAWWTNWDRRSAGLIPIDSSTYEKAQMAVSMLNQHSLAMEIHNASEKQVALVGESPIIPGTLAKCLFDLLPMSGPFSRSVVDLKTTNEVTDYACANTTYRFDYQMKLAYYNMLAEAAGYGPRDKAFLIWQKSSYPYNVIVREIDKRDLDIGKAMAINAVQSLMGMTPTKISRYFDTKLKTISLSDWQRNEILSNM